MFDIQHYITANKSVNIKTGNKCKQTINIYIRMFKAAAQRSDSFGLTYKFKMLFEIDSVEKYYREYYLKHRHNRSLNGSCCKQNGKTLR